MFSCANIELELKTFIIEYHNLSRKEANYLKL
jgi:hypothetical protein